MSKSNKYGWVIAALAFFGIDTVSFFVINGFSFDGILDLLFHAWVVYYLIVGVASALKLKKLPPDQPETINGEFTATDCQQESINTGAETESAENNSSDVN